MAKLMSGHWRELCNDSTSGRTSTGPNTIARLEGDILLNSEYLHTLARKRTKNYCGEVRIIHIPLCPEMRTPKTLMRSGHTRFSKTFNSEMNAAGSL